MGGPTRVGLALATLVLLACPRLPPDCEYDSIERCLWERGREAPDPSGEGTPGESGVGNEGEPQLDGDEPYERWAELGVALDQLAELIASGLEWPLVDERARELCGSPPELRDAPGEPPAWVCPLADALELDGHALVLEVGEGVVALTAESLTERASEKLVALALDTAGDACLDGFDGVEGPVNQEFSSCTLRSGPLLYIGRFPQDLDADRWQVSIAVVDSG